jgi:hypothetical protein
MLLVSISCGKDPSSSLALPPVSSFTIDKMSLVELCKGGSLCQVSCQNERELCQTPCSTYACEYSCVTKEKKCMTDFCEDQCKKAGYDILTLEGFACIDKCLES